MSCDIKSLAKIPDLSCVKEYFGFSDDENWLNALYFSIAPTGETLAFAHGAKVLVLTAQWDQTHQQSSFTVSWKCDLRNPNNIVTAIECMPVMAITSSHQSTADWTIITLGLSSGDVIFYTDTGQQIFTQQFHNEAVAGIKAQSGKHLNEELHIIYPSCVVICQGTHLFQMLRTCKHQHQKLNTSHMTDPEETIAYRKWGFTGSTNYINDAAVVGVQKTCAFDHLLISSIEGGFHAKYRSAPPQHTIVLSTGMKPYIGFNYAKEGFVQPVLADVARAVASKIKSALPSWLTGTSAEVTAATPPPPAPSEPMSCRFGLCDAQRTGLIVWLSPDRTLAAVADNLGRVILVDCIRGIAVRVWKGYREAQCGFVSVTEKSSTSSKSAGKTNERRHAVFLVIFAPRRSCIEIWSLQRGPKVAAFSACKNGQLIYNSYGLMGNYPGARPRFPGSGCLFFDPIDQSLKEIVVPFHCALSDANSCTAKDLHLLRRLKICLRSNDGTVEQLTDEIERSCKSLQTDEIRLQCLEMLIRNNKVNANLLGTALDAILSEIQEDDPNEDQDTEDDTQDNTSISLMTKLMASNYKKLVEFYMDIVENNRQSESLELEANATENDTESSAEKREEEHVVDQINVSIFELENMQKLLNLAAMRRTENPSPKVTFQEKTKSSTFTDYLAAFNCTRKSAIRLRNDHSNNFCVIGEAIFSRYLNKGHPIDHHFRRRAEASNLVSGDLMKLLLYYWLDKPFTYKKSEELINDMTHFTAIVQQICLHAGNDIRYDYETICDWWQTVRELMLESPCALRGLLAGMMCRNLAVRFKQREGSNDDTNIAEDANWEQVSQEAAQWGFLVGKLEDIAVLGSILSCPQIVATPKLPIIRYEKPDISLKFITNGGKGIVSELVAKWLAASGCDPSILLEQPETDSKNVDTSEEELSPIQQYMKTLREHFPFSLQPSVLLAQLSWAFMSYWSKNMSSLTHFEAALKCLETFPQKDFSIKHGICCMIWNAHLKIPLEACKKLINRVGKLPKERLCQQDIGISDGLVAPFLEHCQSFIDHFLDSELHEKVDLRFEELLQDGPIPLIMLTVQQHLGNRDILQLHRQLNTVLYLIASLNIKYTKPIQNLFDPMANQTFFADVNKPLSYTLPQADPILQQRRQHFLMQGITAAMDTIFEDLNGVFLKDFILWFERIESLARVWELDVAILNRHKVFELYANGWDTYASQQLQQISEPMELGRALLNVAGRRLNTYMLQNPMKFPEVAAIGPYIMEFLDDLNGKEGFNYDANEIDLENLVNLAGEAFKCLSKKDSRELRIAGQLFDACATMKEMAK